MKFYRNILVFLIVPSVAMEQPPRLVQIARKSIVVDKEHDELEKQPGVVKIADVFKVCKISKEPKIAGLGNNNVKIVSFDGLQEHILLPPSNIEVQSYGGHIPTSLGSTKKLGVFVHQKDKQSDLVKEKIGILDIQTGMYQQLLEGNQWIRRIFYDAKTERLIAVYPENIQLWDLKSGSLTKTITRNEVGHFKHEVAFSKPKSRIINVWNGQIEWYDMKGGVTNVMDRFTPPLANVFAIKESEFAVVSDAWEYTHQRDPERNPIPLIDNPLKFDKAKATYFKSIAPTIHFYHLKKSWSDMNIKSNHKEHIHDLCFLKKHNQLVTVEDDRVKLYDINTQQQQTIVEGSFCFYSAHVCNKHDALILGKLKDAYILDLNKFELPRFDQSE